MPLQQSVIDRVSEISLDPRPRGLTAVFLVEIRSRDEAREVVRLFAELDAHIRVRQLSKGRLMGYAVQAQASDSTIIEAIEEVLRESSRMVVAQRSLDDTILRVVRELCAETESILLPLPRCDICGGAEPFPATVLTLSNGSSSPKISRNYCAACSADASASSNKSFVRSLLGSDDRRLRALAQADLEKRPAYGRPVRFRIRS
jgi:hypothetical protein